MDPITVILPIVTLLLGAGASAGVDAIKHRRDRRDKRVEALRAAQVEDCTRFLDAVHDAAHRLGRTAPDCPYPLPRGEHHYWGADADAARAMRRIEVSCPDDVRDAARIVVARLRSFRDVVEDLPYGGPQYQSALRPFQQARGDFIAQARMLALS
ncbi:hypothetical protein [Microbacterium sp. zg.Y909]|uniref:hypothetical protein n=1 Tax=Microbacterium sp. zg.Y909 TaxID=2969413 RepID=UPI00214B0927|nr:hypothetical protein [Microbacterium sp. zg.Y909]MCR2824702.1 hypothetical protein [Microbacterium sp. zg.Y909]